MATFSDLPEIEKSLRMQYLLGSFTGPIECAPHNYIGRNFSVYVSPVKNCDDNFDIVTAGYYACAQDSTTHKYLFIGDTVDSWAQAVANVQQWLDSSDYLSATEYAESIADFPVEFLVDVVKTA